MRTGIGLGGSMLVLLMAAVAIGDEPAKAKEGSPEGGRKVVVQAVEAEPGTLRVEVTADGVKIGQAEKATGQEEEAPGPIVDLRRLLRGGPMAEVSDYWIGLQCFPAEGALRSHLKLAEGTGLVIESVAEESPAAKAGLKQYDVLVAAGGKPVGEVADLVEAVDKAKESKLSLELFREGKKKKIDVTPAMRPTGPLPGAERQPLPMLPVPGNPDMEALKRWHEQFQPGQAPPMRYKFFHPGMILPPGAPVAPPLPEDMSVAITRHGDEPAKIVVRKGEKTWEVTEKTLDKLPEDARPHVERMLGRLPGRDLGIEVEAGPAPGMHVPSAERQLKHELDQMNRQIDELRKAVDRLQDRGEQPKKK